MEAKMKKFALLIFVLLFTNIAAISQSPCLPEGITFSNQAQIDSFQINYPGCQEIGGDVSIGNAITNLNGLIVLTSIGGYLQIQDNTNMISLAGLNNLALVDSCIWIGNNTSLTNLSGLEGLTYVGDFLSIFGNKSLNTITALKNLTYIGDELSISFNDSLASLTGLEGLSSVGGHLDIGGSPILTNLAGLDNITSIGGGLLIGYNKAIVNFAGLEGLTSIGAGSIQISENPALVSLTGLDNIDAGTLNYLHLGNNVSLSTCDVKSICAYLAAPGGTVEILYNATGCNNAEEVMEACPNDVEEIIYKDEIAITPNPANDKITISSPALTGNTLLSVFNVSGEKVFERQLTGTETQIDISALPQGVYFVRVQDEKGIEVGKIIKQ